MIWVVQNGFVLALHWVTTPTDGLLSLPTSCLSQSDSSCYRGMHKLQVIHVSGGHWPLTNMKRSMNPASTFSCRSAVIVGCFPLRFSSACDLLASCCSASCLSSFWASSLNLAFVPKLSSPCPVESWCFVGQQSCPTIQASTRATSVIESQCFVSRRSTCTTKNCPRA